MDGEAIVVSGDVPAKEGDGLAKVEFGSVLQAQGLLEVVQEGGDAVVRSNDEQVVNMGQDDGVGGGIVVHTRVTLKWYEPMLLKLSS